MVDGNNFTAARVSLMLDGEVIAFRLFSSATSEEVDQFADGALVAARALGARLSAEDLAQRFAVNVSGDLQLREISGDVLDVSVGGVA